MFPGEVRIPLECTILLGVYWRVKNPCNEWRFGHLAEYGLQHRQSFHRPEILDMQHIEFFIGM